MGDSTNIADFLNIITIDIDWCPDWIVEKVASVLIDKGVKSTWFVTHESPAIKKLKTGLGLFELGIHPNFLPGSSHGYTQEKVLEYVLQIVPEAICVRTHGLFQSTHLMKLFVESGIKIDVSLFLPDTPNIQPHTLHFGTKKIVRIPFFWADDHETMKIGANWKLSPYLSRKGLKIYNFHPIHIYLNSSNRNAYQNLKKDIGDITKLRPEMAERYIEKGRGTRTFFYELLDYFADHGGSLCIRDIYDLWLNNQSVLC